jgi:glycosyltransferase involved in cell wall biosynthesis
LASLPHKRFGRAQWITARVPAQAIIANSFGANLLSLRNGPHVAYWVHSTRSVYLQPGARRADLLLRRAIDWLAVRRAAQLLANSRYTALRLRELYHRDADAIVYPGVDLTLFTPGEMLEPPYAITVGRLSPEKGIARLLELWRDIPDLPLHVVGPGASEWRSLAPAGVFFRGALNGAELAEAYRGAAVAVFAPHGEEFGLAPLEAMASGVPVIAWREGGLQESVIDSETGFLVSDAVTFRQRVRLLLHDRRLRALLAEAARARAAHFSWAQTAAQMEAVCQRLALTSSA